jgi:hypothetical protein
MFTPAKICHIGMTRLNPKHGHPMTWPVALLLLVLSPELLAGVMINDIAMVASPTYMDLVLATRMVTIVDHVSFLCQTGS